jgi:predicted transcriptional regulator
MDVSTELTAQIVAAYAEKNILPPAELPALIRGIYRTLSTLGEPVTETPEVAKLTAAQIRKSVTPDHLVSFEDGRNYKSLKRHLSTRGLTPDQYRVKWGLPSDYPMVSPNYSAARSALAKSMGLGAKPKAVAAPRKTRTTSKRPA